MNCANHPDIAGVAYCRTCGKPLCQSCQRPAQGTIFCEEHAVVQPASPAAGYSPYGSPAYGSQSYASPYTAAPPNQGPSAGLAFVLGLIPGVGAIYNGQYAKGMVHVVILGLLITLASSDHIRGWGVLFGFMIPVWFFYMAFEAYHTALKRQRGEVVDEFSGVFSVSGPVRGFPVGPVLLIALGVILLLDTLDMLPMRLIIQYGPPVFLITLGAYLLYARLTASPTVSEPASVPHQPAPTSQEVGSEN